MECDGGLKSVSKEKRDWTVYLEQDNSCEEKSTWVYASGVVFFEN